MYRRVEYYPGDPILSLVETFRRDERLEKVDLNIGIYPDDEGKVPVLESVRRAETERTTTPYPSPHLPMEGLDIYRSAIQRLLFGQDNQALAEGRVAAIQTLGGSGALKVGADFLHRQLPEAKAYISDPTWGNHKGIFGGAGFEAEAYPYYNPETVGVKFEEMTAFFKTLSEDSILILHPCCQNPTGADVSQAQRDEVLDTIKTHKLILFMGIAYQGFGEDLGGDAYAIHRAVEVDLPLFVSNSFSRNLSLYDEHIGGLNTVCPNKEEAELVFGQPKFTVCRTYPSPVAHGTYIASDMMSNDDLRALWENEVYVIRGRIRAMHQKLYGVLTAKIPNHDFRYFIKQHGMFSYTSLTIGQVCCLRDEFTVYLLDSGRMYVTGLNTLNIDYVIETFTKVLQQPFNLRLNVVLFEVDQKAV